MSVINDRDYWAWNGMEHGQEQAEHDYETGQGRDYTGRSYSYQIGYAAAMEKMQLTKGRKQIRDLVPASLNRRGVDNN